jgi:transcriptional antiterminator NusG
MTETEQNTEVTSEETSEEVTTEEATPDEATPEVVTTEVVALEETPEVVSEAEEEAAPETQEETPEGEEPQTREGMNWFVLRVASNKEDFVRNALEKKVQIEGVQHLVGRIMVPTEKTKTLTKTGKTKITETKLYPGYIFVEMKLVDANIAEGVTEKRISQDVFFLIKETTGVGDFVGTAGKPTPMPDEEVDKMLYDSQAAEEVTEIKLEFAKGDHVNVKDGPFMGYEGTVDDIFPEKGVVRVLATVFGRQTQIDIEYWMIEKAE